MIIDWKHFCEKRPISIALRVVPIWIYSNFLMDKVNLLQMPEFCWNLILSLGVLNTNVKYKCFGEK